MEWRNAGQRPSQDFFTYKILGWSVRNGGGNLSAGTKSPTTASQLTNYRTLGSV